MILFLFGLCLVLAYAVQTATGFGGMLVATALGTFFLPMEQVAPLMTPISLLQTGFVSWRNRWSIDRNLLTKHIFPGMAIGMPVGALLGLWIQGSALRWVFGLVIGFLVVRDLVGMAPPPEPSRTGIASAGVAQGLLGTGGPLLVWALGRLPLSPLQIRATLSFVWWTTDIALLFWWASRGRVTPETLGQSLWLLPAVPVGVLIGEVAFKRLDTESFKKVLSVGLALTALVLLLGPR